MKLFNKISEAIEKNSFRMNFLLAIVLLAFGYFVGYGIGVLFGYLFN